ncbi:MAG: hypothetical protein U0270_05115 [Labilithrix sp.]
MRRPGLIPALGWVILAVACGEPQSPSTVHIATAIGEQHDGTYNLGPVALHGSFWNSCSPYAPELEASLGENLAGLALAYNGDGSLCDTCVTLKRANGKQVTARVITTGETVGQNDIDLSQKAFEALGGDDYPRRMTWALVKCPNSGGSGSSPKIKYQFQTEANPYWTSLWVRGARLPLRTVEVRKNGKGSWIKLDRGTDGTLTDASGFGTTKFELRLTAYDGQVLTDSFDKFSAGAVLTSSHQFD